MPRLLAKLIQQIKASKKEIEHNFSRKSIPTFRHTRRAIPKALPPPSFSPQARKRSILLDEVNPIMHRDAFVQHKKDGPILPSVAGRGKHTNTNRQIREMTNRECQWWSDPYLRMLSSPLRQCLVTQKYLPVDFLVRLAVLQVTGPRLSQSMLALLPDGIEHPRFRRRNSGRGYYLTVHKMFVDEMTSRSSYKRIPASKLRVHSLLASQIGNQLRLRVLQELELMTESLRCAPQSSLKNIIIRRLTRTEWAELKTSGRISQSGAVAVLVVPPLDKRKRQERSGQNNERPSRPLASLPPLSVLHGTQVVYDDISLNSLISTVQVPLYNGLALFPCRTMRSRLYKTLQKALLVERRARWRESVSSRSEDQPSIVRPDKQAREKASHAYLLRSDGNTVRRADSVPVAIALWRLRMWEGQGWEGEGGNYNGWEVKPSTERNVSES